MRDGEHNRTTLNWIAFVSVVLWLVLCDINGLLGFLFALVAAPIILLIFTRSPTLIRFYTTIASAPSWFYHLLVVFTGIYILSMSCSRVGPHAFHVLMLGLVMLILATTWLFRLINFAILALRFRPLPANLTRGWPRWFLAPAITVVVWGLAAADIPFKVAFAVSLPAMEQLAHDAATSKQTRLRERHVGAFFATNITNASTGVLFSVSTECMECDQFGFAYFPDGKTHEVPPLEGQSPHKYTTQLTAKWWVWENYSY